MMVVVVMMMMIRTTTTKMLVVVVVMIMMMIVLVVYRCENVYNDTTECERRALQGECNTNPGFMIAQCSKTCLGCGQKDPGMQINRLSMNHAHRLFIYLFYLFINLINLLIRSSIHSFIQ